jgi:hypothetical protein
MLRQRKYTSLPVEASEEIMAASISSRMKISAERCEPRSIKEQNHAP